MPYNVSFISLGCAKNQVNCEQMMATVQHAGHNVVLSPEGADVAVVNTCGFLASACEEAIDNILEMAELKKEGKLKKIIVTGCMAQRYKDDVLHELPEVDAVLGTGSYGEIARAVDEVMAPGGLRPCYMGDIQNCVQGGARILSTPSWYAYLRIAEGCDNWCAFCAIPAIRGRYRSRALDAIVQEAKDLAALGVKELIVIAQDTTYYGLDLYGDRKLGELLRRLCRIDGIEWIRLHYAYPAGFPDEVIEAMASEPKICKYLDIPFQHISDAQLASMHRRHTKAEAMELIGRLRGAIPDLALRTTLLVGYPGETEADFEELLAFVREVRFERLGVFPYSEEEGTWSAENLRDDIPETIKQQRAERVMALQNEISLENNRRRVGRTERVIIDSRQGDWYVGRTQYDSPEVDQEILIPASERRLLRGHFYDVTVTSAADLYGEIAAK